jgi:hypothetical protein
VRLKFRWEVNVGKDVIYSLRMWTGLIWLRIGMSIGLL